MALRIRENGNILCAAMSKPEEGDTYIHDGIHYMLSQITVAIIPSDNHEEDRIWFWNVLPEMKEHYLEILKNIGT